MEPVTSRPSLFDCVKWAYNRPGLKRYTFEQLAVLFLEHPPVACYAAQDDTGRLRGTAIAFAVSDELVHVAYIMTDGSAEAMDGLVRQLKRDFPRAVEIGFNRRGRLRTFPIDKLSRLVNLK